jgi:hypothetical protein
MKGSFVMAAKIGSAAFVLLLAGAAGCVAEEPIGAAEQVAADLGNEEPSGAEDGISSEGDGEIAFAIEGEAVLEKGLSLGDGKEQPPSTQSYGYLEGTHQIAGGLFGVSYDLVFGWASCPWGRPREYAEAWAYNNQNGAANCYTVRWYNDGNPYDCRVVVHVGSRAFAGGTCVMRVWVR